MKESCVGAFARAARWIALAAVALVVGAGTLHAQATGKLEGRIRDQAGAPVPGAQVRIEGTAFGAVANNQGYYFLNNVPAGSVDAVLAAMRAIAEGVDAVRIGSVVADHPGMVTMRTIVGSERIVDMLVGEQLPRIC